MARISDSEGRAIITRPGLQLQQYVAQLIRAGFLRHVKGTTGRERHAAQHHLSRLVRDLRSGRVGPDTKEHAKQLRMSITPNPPPEGFYQ